MMQQSQCMLGPFTDSRSALAAWEGVSWVLRKIILSSTHQFTPPTKFKGAVASVLVFDILALRLHGCSFVLSRSTPSTKWTDLRSCWWVLTATFIKHWSVLESSVSHWYYFILSHSLPLMSYSQGTYTSVTNRFSVPLSFPQRPVNFVNIYLAVWIYRSHRISVLTFLCILYSISHLELGVSLPHCVATQVFLHTCCFMNVFCAALLFILYFSAVSEKALHSLHLSSCLCCKPCLYWPFHWTLPFHFLATNFSKSATFSLCQ